MADEADKERVLEEIEFEMRQWYAGDHTIREAAERIYTEANKAQTPPPA